MKTLYLHMGTHKTGTTAIQRFCTANKTRLRHLGYAYPMLSHRIEDVPRKRNGHWLAAFGYDEQGNRSEKIAAGYVNEGLAMVEKAFRHVDTVVCSDERLWMNMGRVTHQFKWDLLMQHAERVGYTVKVVVYLRRQDKYLESFYMQTAKGPKLAADSYEEYLKSTRTKADYAKNLSVIAGHVGVENITVRVYDRASFPEGNVVYDFLETIGIDEGMRESAGFEFPERESNPSITPNLLELKRQSNAVPERTTLMKDLSARAMLAAGTQVDPSYRSSLLGPEQTKELLAKYAEGNAEVARTYLGSDEPLFSDDVSGVCAWEKDNPYMRDDTLHYLLALFNEQCRVIEDLEQRIAKLEGHSALGDSIRSKVSRLGKH